MVPPLITATLARALARGQLLGDAVPGEARTEFGELIGGVAAGEHVEHGIEDAASKSGVGRGLPDQGEERVGIPGSIATMATICWARTSSGLRG